MTVQETVPDLTGDQRARVAALHAAREVLRTTNAFQVKPGDVTDLHSLADYILSGEDPWRKPYPMPGAVTSTMPEARPSCAGTCEGVPCNGVECPPASEALPLLSKNTRVFQRKNTTGRPRFDWASEEDNESATLRISQRLFDDFGQPDDLTVTLEPGDRLNPPDCCAEYPFCEHTDSAERVDREPGGSRHDEVLAVSPFGYWKCPPASTPAAVAVNAVLDALAIEVKRPEESGVVSLKYVLQAIDEARPTPV